MDFNTLMVVAIGQVKLKPYIKAMRSSKRSQTLLLRRTQSRSVAFLITLIAPGVSAQYERVHALLLRDSDDEVLAFRQAISDECNMSAISVRLCLM